MVCSRTRTRSGLTTVILLLLSCAKSHMLSASRRQPHQSINQFNSKLAAREPDSKRYAVEIIDKNSMRNKQCAYMYSGAGRDVWSGLGVTMLVGNGVVKSL